MKKLISCLLVFIVLITTLPVTMPTVYSQEPPLEDMELLYPIEDGGERGGTPAFTYPFEEMADLIEDSGQDRNTYNAPLPEPELVEVDLSEDSFEFEEPTIPFSIETEPSIYVEGLPINLNLILSEDELARVSGKILQLHLPEGFVPTDKNYENLMNPDGLLSVNLSDITGSVTMTRSERSSESVDEIVIYAKIIENDVPVYEQTLTVPTHGYRLNERTDIDSRINIQSGDERTANDLLFYSGQLRRQSIPGYSLSLHPIEVLAVDPISGTNVTQFNQPLQISLGYDEGEFTADEENNLQAFYYNELYRDWYPIETTTDPETNQVHFETNHLTVFDIKVANWQSYIPPITQSYEVSGFTGAMTYNYPLQTFAGPGGLKPDLTLRYNSQVIDQSIAYTQASWVGMGWTLEAGSITRDMHGTDDNPNDDTFFLSINGISQRLLPTSQENNVIQYRSQENPTEKIFWNTLSDIWEVRTGDGLIYTFGGTNAVAKLKKGSGCALLQTELNLTWQWGLSSVRDRFGNTITYEYIPEIKGISDTDTYEDKYCYNHINLTLKNIHYGSFDIDFKLEPDNEKRMDYRSSWQHYQSKVLFTRQRLDHVDIKVNGAIVKSYLFKYARDNETNNVIYPNFKWFHGNGKTSTLISIQEVQTSGVSPVEGYKPITFSYAVDHMHLDKIDNGYGGKINFTYDARYHADDINKDERTARWHFSERPCTHPKDDRRGWYGDGYTSVQCINDTEVGPCLILWYNQNFASGTVHAFPEQLLKPGARLIFYHEAMLKEDESTPSSSFGFRSVQYPTDQSLVNKTTIFNLNRTDWVHGQGSLTIPSDYDINDINLFVENHGARISDIQVQQFITRYVVTQRTETDVVNNKSATWTYTYADEGFKMNVGIGSNPYVKTNMEFRGFSSVTITQREGASHESLVTVQTFHQGDLLKGRLISEKTMGSNGLCYSQNLYTYNTSTLYSNSNLIGLTNFTDLAVVWIKLSGVEKQSFNGADCNSLPGSNYLATQEVYSYADADIYKNMLNGEPKSVVQRVYNGFSWSDEFATIFVYENSTDLTIGGRTYFFSRVLSSRSVKACSNGNCNGALQAETLYLYNTNKTLKNQKIWTKVSGTVREYSQTDFTYHSNGSLATRKVWQGFSTATGSPTGASSTTHFTYDSVFPTQIIEEKLTANNRNYVTSTAYDPRFGLPVQVNHPNGAIEYAVYDGLGRTIRICAPGDVEENNTCELGTGFTLNINYNLNAPTPQITIQRKNLASVLFKYTGFGKLSSRTILGARIGDSTVNWEEKSYDYDGLGRVVIERNGGLASFTFYDVLGRIATTGRVAGSTLRNEATYSYALETIEIHGANVKVWKTSVTDAKGNISFSYTNAKGQTIKTSPPTGSGPSVLYTYDLLGRLTQTDYGNSVTTINYNPAGQKTHMVDPDMGTWDYTYDAQGNLLTQTTQRDLQPPVTITTTLTYDNLNRLLTKSFSDGTPTVSYTYDANGNIGHRTGMTDGTGSTSWIYDARGRLTTETKTIAGQIFTTSYTYDSADQMTSMTYPSGESVIITHLPQGGVYQVGGYLNGTKVDAYGRISQRNFGNGTHTALTYQDWLTDAGRLGTIQSGANGNLVNLSFTYDRVGNMLTLTDHLNSNQKQTFTYDALNRLKTAATNGLGQGHYNQSYEYDPVTGNLSNKSDVGGYSYSQTQPHAVTGAGTNSYTYDRNGNMKTRTVAGKLWTYSYNAEGKITAVRKDGQLISEYGYDGDGNRVWAKDYEGYQASYPSMTLYVGNYYELVSDGRPPEQGTASVCTGAHCTYMPFMYKAPKGISYYYADGQRIAMRSNNTVSWLYGDQLGSVSAVAKADGTLISRSLYYPWGSERLTQGTSPTDYGYTGQMREGDIYYYNARWYDPMIGRFMQADTIVPLQVQGIQAFDRYAYVNNNPVNGTDPTGMWMCGDQYDFGCAENANEEAIFTSMEFGLGILDGQSYNYFTILQDYFSITHYIYAREDDPIYINDPIYNGYATGPVPGLPSTNYYNYGFIYSDRGVVMQGTGLAKDGNYITIDWLKSDVEKLDWVFTYGIGGKWGEPQPWVTIATGDPRLPPGTKVVIQGYPGRVFIVGDTGYDIGRNQIDIFIGLAFTEEAFNLGKFYSKIGIIK